MLCTLFTVYIHSFCRVFNSSVRSCAVFVCFFFSSFFNSPVSSLTLPIVPISFVFLLNLICYKRIGIVFNFFLLGFLFFVSFVFFFFEILNNKLASFYLIAILLMWTGSHVCLLMWFSRFNNVTVVCTQYSFRILRNLKWFFLFFCFSPLNRILDSIFLILTYIPISSSVLCLFLVYVWSFFNSIFIFVESESMKWIGRYVIIEWSVKMTKYSISSTLIYGQVKYISLLMTLTQHNSTANYGNVDKFLIVTLERNHVQYISMKHKWCQSVSQSVSHFCLACTLFVIFCSPIQNCSWQINRNQAILTGFINININIFDFKSIRTMDAASSFLLPKIPQNISRTTFIVIIVCMTKQRDKSEREREQASKKS